MVARARDGGSISTAKRHKATFWSDGNILYLDLLMIVQQYI